MLLFNKPKLSLLISLLFIISIKGVWAQVYHKPFSVIPAVERKWTNFELSAVRLKEGSYFKQIMDQQTDYLLSLDPERLIKNVMNAANIPHNDKLDYGGWQRGAGNGFANYLAAISIAYAATGNKEFKERADWMVDQIAQAQEKEQLDGYFFINGNKEHDPYWDLMRASNNVNLRNDGGDFMGWWGGMAKNAFYQLHRVFAGVRDAYVYTDNEKAKRVFLQTCDWICLWTNQVSSDSSLQKALEVEHGGIAELLVDAYAFTGLEKYKLAADRWTHKENLATPLAAGKDVLPGRHANVTNPKFLGLIWNYEMTGDSKKEQAAVHAWEILHKSHTLPNGGHGLAEHYGEAGKLLDHLGYKSTETCNTYNQLKFTRHLFNLYGEVKYLDDYERGLYNHILGSIDPGSEDIGGGMCYFTGLLPGMFKEYMGDDAFYCCWETGLENHVKYGEAIYFAGEDGLLVNLFIPSALKWEEKGLEMALDTHFPENDTISLTINKLGSFKAPINFRYPTWAKEASLLVNGEEQAVMAQPGEIIQISHNWVAGDKIDLVIPLELRVEDSNDPNVYSLFYGPVLLAADMGPVPAGTNVYSNFFGGPSNADYNGSPDFPTINLSADNINERMVKREGKFVFEVIGDEDAYTYIPAYSAHHKKFSIYSRFDSERELREKKKYIADRLIPGIEATEIAHDYKVIGHQDPGWFSNRPLRHVGSNSSVQYRLNLNPEAGLKHYLKLKFYGWEEAFHGHFSIYVDGKKIAEQGSLKRLSKYNIWSDLYYGIPLELTAGKEYIEVKMQSDEEHGFSLFGLELVTENYLQDFCTITEGLVGKPMSVPFLKRLEAESAQNKELRFHASASNASYSNIKEFVQFNNLFFQESKPMTIEFRYAANQKSKVDIVVNGETVPVILPSSGENVTDFASYFMDISLQEGFNFIQVNVKDQTIGLDYIELKDQHNYENAPVDDGPFFERYEAELAEVNNAWIPEDTYEVASNGSFVGKIDHIDSHVMFEIEAMEEGIYELIAGYGNGTGNTSSHQVFVNGKQFENLVYPSTSGWSEFSTAKTTVELKKGTNQIKIAKGDSYAQLDYIDVTADEMADWEVVSALYNCEEGERFTIYPNLAGLYLNLESVKYYKTLDHEKKTYSKGDFNYFCTLLSSLQ
ncbi:glycoside hydrolase family 127 protein [Echinicola marina]|uniref:beta-L-arabinofuranosidase domain-containing protein n=1 Tax=Echinicola marina TaxID=2859768 RepID=UPI001CF66C53|nr:beta-L-arabinofuranosidase domain-containing protein [Echinicola marina]UCS91836.1 glycoside hydrolase family 127 protein [Echinicola marina]